MLKNKTILSVLSIMALSGCSSVSGMFNKKEDPRLEGERISVLELQKTLTPDASDERQPISVPKVWKNDAWPQAGGYPNHLMQNLSLSGGQLSNIWSASIGHGSTDKLPLMAQPVVAQGKVFTLDTRSTLTAFDAQSGKRVWETDVEKDNEDDSVISGGVAFAHETLFVTNGYDEVLAVSPANGDIIWRKRLPAPSRAAPTIIGGRVFISTIDSRLVSLSAKDGTALWEYTGISEATGLVGAASPAATNDIVIPAFSSGEITALRVENGSVAWSDNLANVRRYGGGLESLSDIRAMPVAGNGIVVAISFGGKIAAIDERTGARLWQRDIGGSQTPWVSGKMIYVLSSEGQLVALDITNGSVVWIEELKQFEDERRKEDPIRWTGPVMGGNRLIALSSHGSIVEINPANGQRIRENKTKKNIQIAPVIAGDTLYVLSDDGKIMAYR